MDADAKVFRRKISIKKSSVHRYGVFADENIKVNAVIEKCPIVIFNTDEKSLLGDYTFTHKENGQLLALGYGSLYNHSSQPNASYSLDSENDLFVFYASRSIKKGEEIYISYGESWFESRGWIANETLPNYHGLISFAKLVLRFSLAIALFVFLPMQFFSK
jgi:SET domain-containing protein